MDFTFDACQYRFPSRRSVVYARKGMVCTSQPLAAQAGLDCLKKGGNAVDAAITTAACMAVLEPTSNGLGGDAFAIVYMKGKLNGLNASGPAPMAISAEKVKAQGYTEMPTEGFIPVTVPGIPSAWAELSEKYGNLPFEELLEPAAKYAEEGYPVSPVISQLWNGEFLRFSAATGGKGPFQYWFEVFAPNGRAPKPGEIWRSQELADSLREIGRTKAESFYRGRLADCIDAFSRQYGGYIRKEDLASYRAKFVDPIKVNYRGYDVWELPPNGHGIVALMALNILNGFSFQERDSADSFHKRIEAMKLAFVDGKRYVADPDFMKVTLEQLLSAGYAEKRRKSIEEGALFPQYGDPACGDTVYLCTADQEGNMVSYIQSNYHNFGSGLVVPKTGIALHNRGSNFSLEEAMENCIAPGKKPYHTIIPGFLTKDGKPVGPFGVMGGFMQPQGHVQLLTNLIDFHMNPQEALDAPRWMWTGGKTVEVEMSFPQATAQALLRKGHSIVVKPEALSFGRGQLILQQENGVYIGATEPRADGTVAAW